MTKEIIGRSCLIDFPSFVRSGSHTWLVLACLLCFTGGSDLCRLSLGPWFLTGCGHREPLVETKGWAGEMGVSAPPSPWCCVSSGCLALLLQHPLDPWKWVQILQTPHPGHWALVKLPFPLFLQFRGGCGLVASPPPHPVSQLFHHLWKKFPALNFLFFPQIFAVFMFSQLNPEWDTWLPPNQLLARWTGSPGLD